MPGVQESFGSRIRHLREAAGLSQEALAERAGLSTNAISAIERGERKRPYPDTIRRLSSALELSDLQREQLATAARTGGDRGAVSLPERLDAPMPVEPDDLLGRDHEIGVTRKLLARGETRLLTLTGPGGIGKTRLALRLARLLHATFPGGIVWVDLAPLADDSLVMPAIGKALGVAQSPGQPIDRSIPTAIGRNEILLVLDNVEHVRGSAPALSGLLAQCPGLKILATSRAPLAIRGEQEYVVPPLSLPVGNLLATAPSVQLFLRAVRLRQPSFTIDPGESGPVAEICRRLDGVPLALELAASRVPLLGVHELLARLDAALPLLTGGKRDTPSRQRTMESAIRWSYDLLQPADQHLFRLLSVFSGGWTLEAVETVAERIGAGDIDVLDGMSALIEHSLVRRNEDLHRRPRYSMLGTFREFARLRLRESGEEAAAVDAHLRWITSLVETAEPHLFGPAQDFWLDQLAMELDNIRAALGADTPADAGDRLALAAAFWRFWYMRGYFLEGRSWLERCLATPGSASDDVIAKALNGAGILAQESGDFASADALYARALEIRRELGDVRGVAYTLSNLGLLADHRGDYDRAIALYEESLALSRELEHLPGVGNALNNLGLVYRDIGDLPRAQALHEESLAVLRRIGDQRGTANALNNLGNIAFDAGDLPRAKALHRESLEIRRRLDDRPGIAMSLKNLATLSRDEGDLSEAALLYRESLDIRAELSDQLGAIPTLGEVAALASIVDAHDVATRLVAAIHAIRDRLGAPAPPAAQERHEAILRDASNALSPTAHEAAVLAGASLDGPGAIRQAVDFLERFNADLQPASSTPERAQKRDNHAENVEK